MSHWAHPCPCGYYGDSQKPCTCAHALVTKYQKRISGPLLDRIDIHIEVPGVDYEKLSGDQVGEVGQGLMRAAMMKLNLSAPANHRTQCVKLRCTIADLAACGEIQSLHLAEALQNRLKLMLS